MNLARARSLLELSILRDGSDRPPFAKTTREAL